MDNETGELVYVNLTREGFSMPHLATLIIFIFIVSGCTSDTIRSYDQDAVKKTGTIHDKQEIENHQEFRNDTILMPVAGAFVPIQLGSPMKDGNDFRYMVRITEGQTIPIISKFSGFEVGECVTVFLSKIMSPRIAHGGDCN
jgi:hypothetical protein